MPDTPLRGFDWRFAVKAGFVGSVTVAAFLLFARLVAAIEA
ncbi:MAG TPA: hypothetical protein VKQ71_17565 [Acidimicrobiales bacterium]|nr:hypothetical protein [Acidimicrobiales bacterium]